MAKRKTSVKPAPEVWTKLGAIIEPELAWEGPAVYEPSVFPRRGGMLRMIYDAGWDHAAIGTATSKDGIKWAKSGRPIIGQGAAGIAGGASCNSILRWKGVDHIYFARNDLGAANGIYLAHTTDYKTVTVEPTAVIPLDDEITLLGNCHVAVDLVDDNPVFRMVYEAATATGWQMFLAFGTSPTDMIKDDRGPIKSLQVGRGMYGGPVIYQISGHLNMWYHASRSGNLQTELYHAFTPNNDRFDWTILNGGQPILGLTLPFEVDQVADAFPVDRSVIGGPNSHLYYDGDDNAKPSASIALATYNGPLSAICP